MMPGMDGIEFLDRFRRMPAHVRTPVLIWTMKDLTAAEHEQLRQSRAGRRVEERQHAVDGRSRSCAR